MRTACHGFIAPSPSNLGPGAQVLDACGKVELAMETRQALARVGAPAGLYPTAAPSGGGSAAASPAGGGSSAAGDAAASEGAAGGAVGEPGGLKRAVLSELDRALMKSTAKELERHGAQVGRPEK